MSPPTSLTVVTTRHALELAAWLLVALVSSIRVVAADSILLEVSAGTYDRPEGTPVAVLIPPHLAIGDRPQLRCVETGELIGGQLVPGPPRRLQWMLSNPIDRGARRRYELCQHPRPDDKQKGVTAGDDGAHLLVSVNGRSVLQYNYKLVPSPLPENTFYERSGYLHPVFSPAGRILTDGMPAQHTHQHGVMFAWVNTSFENREVDFWNTHKGLGRVEHKSLDKVFEGPVVGGFAATLQHVDLTAPAGAQVVLKETWEVRVLALEDPFVWDLYSTQEIVGQNPLNVNHYHYGGLMVRGSAQWIEPSRCNFVTSLGDHRTAGNHTRPRWVTMHGSIDGRPAGVTVLCHPHNFRAPQHVRLHPSLPYFCFAPMVPAEFQLIPGKPYRSQYRFVAFDGLPDPQTAERWWQDYVAPPQVTICERENDQSEK